MIISIISNDSNDNDNNNNHHNNQNNHNKKKNNHNNNINNNIYICVCVIWNLELYSKKNMQGNYATLAMGLNQLYEMMG
jgi:hypothetical protein